MSQFIHSLHILVKAIKKMEEVMKKVIISLIMIIMLSSMVSAITLDDLEIPDKVNVKEYLISNFEEISQINFEDLDGVGYEIFAVGNGWVMVEVEGEIYIIFTD